MPNFLHEFVAYAAEITDASENFLDGIALGVLSAVAAPRVYIQHAGVRLRPNLYLLVCGESTTARKSTTINIGRRIAEQVECHFAANEASPEAFLTELAMKPHQMVTYDEFGSTLAVMEKKEYMRGMKAALTTLYDCPPRYTRSLKKETIDVIEPVLSIWGASTWAWLAEAVSEYDLRSGFLARFLFVNAGAKRQSLAFPPPPDQQKETALVQFLKGAAELSGEMNYSPDAKAHYERWYGDVENRPFPELLSAFRARYQTYAHKLAMLETIAAAQGLLIPLDAAQRATARIDAALVALKRLEAEEIGMGREQRDQNQIKRALRNGVVEHSALMREVRIGKVRIDAALRTLLESEQIDLIEHPRTDRRGGKSRREYRLMEAWEILEV